MTTRRNAIKFMAGAGVGALFTPAPWKLIRDTALWSQNWPGIPKPLRGAITEKATVCSLCPAGCAVRVKCVGEQPIAIAGVGGGLCATAVTAHHLPYWPERVKQGPVEEAKAAVAKVGAAERVAVLDLRPGRAASAVYRKAMAARPNGLYLAPPESGFAVNLAAAKTVISFGAPVLDGWVAPSAAWAARDRFRLVQVEPELSRTAALADEWLVRGNPLKLPQHYEGPVLVADPEMSPEAVAMSSRETVMPLAPNGAAALRKAEDESIRLLYIDESQPGVYVPWPEIAPKLAKDAVVIAFAWSKEGYARHANFVLPTAVFPEATEVMKAPEWTVDPVEFVAGEKAEATALEALPDGFVRVNSGTAWVGPISSKLSQESNLLLAPRQVAVHPEAGIAERSRAFLAAAHGRVAVEVVHDASLPPGGVRYLATPEILDLGAMPKVVAA
jgi:hypothetical protein